MCCVFYILLRFDIIIWTILGLFFKSAKSVQFSDDNEHPHIINLKLQDDNVQLRISKVLNKFQFIIILIYRLCVSSQI